MKANCKRLKVVLVLEVKKLSPFFLMSKLGKFLLFVNFWDLDNFPVFDNFPHFSINLSQLSTPPTLLAASTLSMTNIYDDIIVYSIDVIDAAILLKP